MNALKDLRLFVRAARAASLSEAARALDVTPAAASATIRRLERELDVKLFARSTRELRLTLEGERFLAGVEAGLEQIAQAADGLSDGPDTVRGTLRLSMPSDLGRNLILDGLHQFRKQHPGVGIHVQVSDRIAGLYREQVDVALRYGEPPDSSLVMLPVAPDNARVLCASPVYVRKHGSPTHPSELAAHECLCFMLNDRVHNRWTFTRGTETIRQPVSGSFVCDDGDAVRRLAVLGAGIAYKSRLDVADDLRRGTLVALCPRWRPEPAPLFMACTDRRALRPAVRALHAFLVERCAAA